MKKELKWGDRVLISREKGYKEAATFMSYTSGGKAVVRPLGQRPVAISPECIIS